MIYFFSGTGNSLRVARQLAAQLGERLLPMTEAWGMAPSFATDSEALGLVFPVYAWGLPLVVDQFVAALPHPAAAVPKRYVYAVLTCGDDIGQTDRLLRSALGRRGWELSAVFSVQLRNTYVCLPGFDVDTPALTATKEARTEARLGDIVERIRSRSTSSAADITPGAFPWLKSRVLRPLFNRFLTSDSHFRCNSPVCTGCGRCAKVCPLANIAIDASSRTPRWKGHCTHCLACYHACPHHAINYGFFTQGKGQVAIIR